MRSTPRISAVPADSRWMHAHRVGRTAPPWSPSVSPDCPTTTMCAAWGEVFTDSGGHLQYFGDLVIFNPYDPGSAAIYNVEPSFVGTIGVIPACASATECIAWDPYGDFMVGTGPQVPPPIPSPVPVHRASSSPSGYKLRLGRPSRGKYSRSSSAKLGGANPGSLKATINWGDGTVSPAELTEQRAPHAHGPGLGPEVISVVARSPHIYWVLGDFPMSITLTGHGFTKTFDGTAIIGPDLKQVAQRQAEALGKEWSKKWNSCPYCTVTSSCPGIPSTCEYNPVSPGVKWEYGKLIQRTQSAIEGDPRAATYFFDDLTSIGFDQLTAFSDEDGDGRGLEPGFPNELDPNVDGSQLLGLAILSGAWSAQKVTSMTGEWFSAPGCQGINQLGCSDNAETQNAWPSLAAEALIFNWGHGRLISQGTPSQDQPPSGSTEFDLMAYALGYPDGDGLGSPSGQSASGWNILTRGGLRCGSQEPAPAVLVHSPGDGPVGRFSGDIPLGCDPQLVRQVSAEDVRERRFILASNGVRGVNDAHRSHCRPRSRSGGGRAPAFDRCGPDAGRLWCPRHVGCPSRVHGGYGRDRASHNVR